MGLAGKLLQSLPRAALGLWGPFKKTKGKAQQPLKPIFKRG
jgi:hypothetical protein